MDKIGVVTVTFNSEDVIDEFLMSVLSQTHREFALYVIDNASNDETLNKIQHYPDPRIVVIKNETNLGIAKGNNQGVQLALEDGCNYVMLLNNDTVFEEDMFSKLVKIIIEKDCSITTPKMMYYSQPDTIWYAGGFFYKRNGYIAHHRGLDEKDLGQYDFISKVDYAPTCCTLIKKEVFEDIGLMDEKYFVYSDDTDFFYRIWMDGRHTMLYVPHIKLYHKVGGLTKSKRGERNSKYQDFYLKYTTMNNIYYLKKQQSLFSRLFIFYYYLKMPLSFLITGRYKRNFKTFWLLQKAFFKGLLQ